MAFQQLLILAYLTVTTLGAGWDYSNGANGPANWYQNYPICGQSSQSPIDIVPTEEPTEGAIVYEDFDNVATQMTLSNNGHAAVISITSADYKVSGGGLPGTFTPLQFHFHWGYASSQGSEHLFKGQAFPMEVHLVTMNDKYYSINDALANADGLAVMGYFFEIAEESDPIIATIAQRLVDVQDKGDSVNLTPFALGDMLPDRTDSYYAYDGSLTTPPCNEVVSWRVFCPKLKITESDMAKFRAILDVNGNPIVDNFRPVQSLNGRVIKSPCGTGLKLSLGCLLAGVLGMI